MIDPRWVALGVAASLCTFTNPLAKGACACVGQGSCAGSLPYTGEGATNYTGVLKNSTVLLETCADTAVDGVFLANQYRGKCWFAFHVREASNVTVVLRGPASGEARMWVSPGTLPFWRPPPTQRAGAKVTTKFQVVTSPDVNANAVLSAAGPYLVLDRFDEGTYIVAMVAQNATGNAASALIRSRWPRALVLDIPESRNSAGVFCALGDPCPRSTDAMPRSIGAVWNNATPAISFALGNDGIAAEELWPKLAALLVDLSRYGLLMGFSVATTETVSKSPEEQWWWPLQITFLALACLGVFANMYQGQCSCRICLKWCPWCTTFVQIQVDDKPACPAPQAIPKMGAPRVVVMR